MPVTQEQLDSFHTFAARRLANGGANLSLEELVFQWREFEESCQDIRQGISSLESGEGRPLEEVVADLRRKYDIPEDA